MFLGGIASMPFGSSIVARYISLVHPNPTRPDPRSNAIPAHVVLTLLVAAVAVTLPRTAIGRRGLHLVWLAPFSTSALDRLRRTVVPGRAAAARRTHPLRALLAICLTLVLPFSPFRAGEQVTAGLDPRFTVNAWGGPTYLGALLARWLDGLILFYAEAFLLDLVMLEAADDRTDRWTASPPETPGAEQPGDVGGWLPEPRPHPASPALCPDRLRHPRGCRDRRWDDASSWTRTGTTARTWR